MIRKSQKTIPGLKRGYNTAYALSSLKDNGLFPIHLAYEINKKREQIDLLRFPGGTLSFDYDISAPYYGNAKTNKYLAKVNPGNFIFDYIDLVKYLDYTPKTIFCLNLNSMIESGDFSDWQNCLLPLRVLNENLGNENIYCVEMGNELFMHFYHKTKIYIDLCNFLIPKIKEICPNALIAVPTEGCHSNRGNDWNRRVNRWIVGFDAISPHFYINDLKLLNQEFTGKTSYLDKGKLTPLKGKVICTEFNYKYNQNKTKLETKEICQDIVDKMVNLATELNFDAMLYHSLLQESKYKYSKYIVKNKLIELR